MVITSLGMWGQTWVYSKKASRFGWKESKVRKKKNLVYFIIFPEATTCTSLCICANASMRVLIFPFFVNNIPMNVHPSKFPFPFNIVFWLHSCLLFFGGIHILMYVFVCIYVCITNV